MKNFFKKYKVPVIAVSVLVVLGLAAFLVFGRGGDTATSLTGGTSEKPIKVLQAEEIGLTLTPRSDGKAIVMEITKLDGISSVEYEVTYDAQVAADGMSEDGQSGITQRGVVGSPIEVKGASSIKRTIDLGTCSKNVCKYDNVVSDIHFVVKVTFSNGDIGSVEKSISL